MLRNLTCTYGNDPVTGLAPSEMGETRMLDILESKLESPHLQIVLQVGVSCVAAVLADLAFHFRHFTRSSISLQQTRLPS